MTNIENLKDEIAKQGMNLGISLETIVIGQNSTLDSVEVVGIIGCIESLSFKSGRDVSLFELMLAEEDGDITVASLLRLAGFD